MDKSKFIPSFVRVFGINPDPPGKNPYLDIEDPAAIPACIVSFVYDRIIYCGWYSPSADFFLYQETDDEDPEKDTHVQAPRDGDIHKACLATMDHFRDLLAVGGNNMEKVGYPAWAICPRQQRTQRQSKKTAASTSATSPTPPSAS